MKITKKERFVEIDPNKEFKRRECYYCSKFGFTSYLGRRPNYNEIDKDLWWYCERCHRTFLERETRMEGRLKSAVDVQAKGDEKTIMGLDNLVPTNTAQRRIKERLKNEKDPDVRALIKQGLDPQDVN